MFDTLTRLLHLRGVEHRQSYTQQAVDDVLRAASGAPIAPSETTAAAIGIRAVADAFGMAGQRPCRTF